MYNNLITFLIEMLLITAINDIDRNFSREEGMKNLIHNQFFC